jgi:benzoyl-CoA reductase/2-hydroxyglutaryl-CoA dehydratase subunit BcrC/BadD/HgdB
MIQSFSCSLARAMLNAALTGELDFLSLMLFPHTCDTIQNLADIWMRHVPACGYAVLATPTGVSGPHAVAFYQSELTRLRRVLEDDSGPISANALAGAIDLYSRHREAMQRLYAARRAHPGLISAADMAAAANSAFLMDRAEHLAMLEQTLPLVEQSPAPASEAPRLLITGAACGLGAYAAAIEDVGGCVVDDEICTGSRAFAVDRIDAPDALESLARSYMSRRPCPAKHREGHHPGNELVLRARECRAEGVIFLLTKFCDPWAFDYPDERHALESAGIPSLLIEIEPNQAPAGQSLTRVAAFIETLNASRRTEAI